MIPSSASIIINTSNNPKRDKSWKISAIPRLLFRLLAYPALFYIIGVYAHAKSVDPDGFKNFMKIGELFNFERSRTTDMERKVDLPAVNTDEIFDTNPPKGQLQDYRSKVPKPPSSLIDYINDQRQKLLTASIRCHRLEAQLGILDSRCYKTFSYHERIWDYELAQNARLYSIPIIEAFKSIHKLFKAHQSETREYNEFMKKNGKLFAVSQLDEGTKCPTIFQIKLDQINTLFSDKIATDQKEIIKQSIGKLNRDHLPNQELFASDIKNVQSRAIAYTSANLNTTTR